MQNVGAPTSLDTNLNTASGEVELRAESEKILLRETLSDNFCKSFEDEELEQLDKVEDINNTNTSQPTVVPVRVPAVEELSPKSKTRSRFTSAFRSFRASKSSKKKLATPTSSSDQVLSSGGEDLEVPQQSDSNSDLKKKKSKLSKKFSLTSIKKNKVNPKKDEEIVSSSTSNLVLVTSSTQTTHTLDRKPIFTTDNDSKRKVTVTTSSDPIPSPYSLSPESSPTKFDKVRKIQITIQGKKIEHTNKTNNTNNTNNNGLQGRKPLTAATTETIDSGDAQPSPNTDEGEYLVATDQPKQQKPSAIPTIAATTTTTATTSCLKKNSKKNKKSKSKPNSPTTSPIASPFSNKSITSSSTNTSTEEKLVVTQSICDTPPRERAPAKPSRAPSIHPFGPTFTSPTGAIRKSLSHQLPRLRRQRVHAFESVDSDSCFMIREGSIDRGRRFPRPASIENHDQISAPIIAQSQTPGLPTPLGISESELESIHPHPNPNPIPKTNSNLKKLLTQSATIIDDEPSEIVNAPSPPSPSPLFADEQPEHETINQKQRKIIIALPSFQSSIGSGLGLEVDSPLPEISSTENSPLHYYATINNKANSLKSELEASENSIQAEIEEENDQSQEESFHQKKQKVISLPSFASTSSLERDSINADGTTDNITSFQSDTSLYFNNNNNVTKNPNLVGLRQDQSVEEETPIICDHRHNTRSIGDTSVRPQRTVIPLSQLVLDSKDFSSFESVKSFGSNQSPISDISLQQRRRIQYRNQARIFTDESRDKFNQEGVGPSSGGGSREGSVSGKRDPTLNYIPGISEYSFESEFSPPDPSMPAFGDLTMDQVNPDDYESDTNENNEPIMTSSQEKREHLYKILVIGELGTGKTSFIKRYVHQFFSQNYRATIGVDFALKVLNWDSNTIVRLQLWDIAGQERFGNMTRVYYKEAVGAFIVFDVTRSGTFDCVSKWKEDLDSKVQLPDGNPIPCILLANKCDQDKQGIITTPEKMDEYVRENGFAGWFETSAKENINIDEAARALVNKILLNDKLISDADIADSEKFNLANSNGGQATAQAIKSKCSC